MTTFGGTATVWVIVLFDLPTDTNADRRAYRKFRKFLLSDSFIQMQYSVYIRHCASDENATVHSARVKKALPPDGEVRIFRITDRQFGRIEVYYGRKRRPPEQAPEQLSFL